MSECRARLSASPRGPERATRRSLRVCCWLLFCAALAACHPARPASPARPALPPAVERLHHDLDAILADPALAHGTWGVAARSLATGETLYAVNALKLLMPASNMKIVTLAAAAATLGWDYSYQTQLFAGGRVESGVLNGDLVVVGSGDPSLGLADGSAERVFADWAERLKQTGIRAIDGRIVGDDRAFEDRTLGFGWSWDDLQDDYAAGVGALQLNENAVRVTVAPGPAPGDAAAVSVDPPGSWIGITNAVRTSDAGSQPALDARRLPGNRQLEIRGSIAAGAAPAVLTMSVDNPTLFFVEALRRALIEHGIDVRGPAVDVGDLIDAPAAPAGSPIATHRSAPLSTLAVRLMKASQNQYAETLLKTLSATNGATATASGGRAAAQKLFETWGIGAGALIQRDGSGLSRYDYVTADALVTILSRVYGDPKLRGPFEASLPVAGRDGTLGNRLKGAAAEGNARAKTGSMSNVRALSGYVTTADGEPVAFAVLANNFETSADVVNRATDAIVTRLAQFRR